MNYYIVSYKGQFGFIKPWTAVRDEKTFSQQFLTPSMVAGIERKLFPELLHQAFGLYHIKRHRLAFDQMTAQQEQIQPRGWNSGKKVTLRNYAVLTRNVLLNPVLHLAFEQEAHAQEAFSQHICLARNEDILFPESIEMISAEAFDQDEERFFGYELIFEQNEKSILVGYNRWDNGSPMYGWLKVLGNPVKSF